MLSLSVACLHIYVPCLWHATLQAYSSILTLGIQKLLLILIHLIHAQSLKADGRQVTFL